MQNGDVVEPIKKPRNSGRYAVNPRSTVLNSKWENEHAHADVEEPYKVFFAFKDFLDNRFSAILDL
jgi:hypothetical protein